MLEFSDLAPIFTQFTEETNIVVTERAQRLIVNLINSVEVDCPESLNPDESLLPDESRLNDYFKRWTTILPEVLKQVTSDCQLSHRMTMLDISYWTGLHLRAIYDDFVDMKICPFPKRRDQPDTTMSSLR